VRLAFNQATDPGESLLEYFKELNPSLQKRLRQEIRRKKGFTNGKVNSEDFRQLFRSEDSERAIFLLTNISCGKEYVGTTEQSVGQKLQQHFKDALGNPNSLGSSAVRHGTRELHHAIRISKLEDWRVLVLEKNIPVETFQVYELHYRTKFMTVWPRGYNIEA